MSIWLCTEHPFFSISIGLLKAALKGACRVFYADVHKTDVRYEQTRQVTLFKLLIQGCYLLVVKGITGYP